MADQPFFSVCLPTYNMGSYIAEAIQSVLDQSFRDFELIVHDNASTDDTEQIVAGFSDPRIRYIRNHENLGMYANLNLACQAATGKYIKTHCADDTLSRGCLEVIHAAIRNHPDSARLLTVRQVSSQSQLVAKPATLNESVLPAGAISAWREQKLSTGLPNICVEREFFSEQGYFGTPDPKNDFSRDCVVFLELMQKSECIALELPLVFERPHAFQNRFVLKKVNQLAEYFDFQKRHLQKISQDPRNLHAWNAFIDELVAAHLVSSLKPILRSFDFSYLRVAVRTLRTHQYRRLPVRQFLARVIAVVRS